MSRREDRHHHLLGHQGRPVCEQDLDARLTSLLDAKMNGIAFSAYTEGQTPGDRLSRDQIERRMAIIAPHFKWIRAFSVTEGNELIPLVAKEMGLNTLVGAWLEAMRPVYEEMRSDSDVIDVDEMSRRSVVHSLNNLLTFPFVVAAVAAGELSLHGAWHDFGTGTLLAYNPDTDSFENA